MTDTQKAALGASIRAILMFIAGRLSIGHLVNSGLLTPALNDLADQILVVVAGLGTYAWSLLDKWLADRRVKIALAMPPASTSAELKTVEKATSPGLIPTGPIPSPSQAAAIVNGTGDGYGNFTDNNKGGV